MPNVGYATLQVIPSMKGAQAKLSAELGAPMEATGKSAGGRLSSALGGALKKGAKAGAVGAAALVGTALYKGFGRLTAIDQAEAKLTGLGHSTKSVAGIMDNALSSVKGTAFGLGDAATAAATAVAAGVKPGKELAGYLKLVGDTATITNSTFDDTARVLNQARTVGAAYNDTLQTLAQRGLPVYALLSKELGKTPAQVKKMASEGKISAEILERALTKQIGGAALEGGKTFSGAFANMQAALGRLGASALSGVFPKLQGAFSKITVGLDKAGPYAEKFGAALGDSLAKAGKYIGPIAKAIGGLFSGGKVSKQMSEFVKTLKSVFESAKSIVVDAISIIQSLWQTFGGTIMSFTKSAFGSIMTIIRGAFTVIQGIFQTVSALLKGDWSGVWEGIKQILSGAWTVIKGLVSAGWAVIKGLFSAAGAALKGIFSGLWDDVKALATAGIGKIVGAVKALPGKIRDLAGKMKDAGKALADKFMSGLKSIAGKAGDIAKGLWNGIKGFLNSAIDKINNAIPNKIGKGKLSINLPDNPFPHFAKGGYIPPRPGGTLAVLAEAGEGEYAVPESKMAALLKAVAGGGRSSGGDVNVTVYDASGSPEVTGRIAANAVLWKLAAS